MNTFYKELPIPKIPNDLLKLDHTVLSTVDVGYNLSHQKNNVALSPIQYTRCVPTHKALVEWMLDNVSGLERKDILLVISRHSTGGYHILHTDKERSWRANYFCELGGTNVITSWYQEKGKPLHRFKKDGWQQTDTPGQVFYDDCETLESVVFKKHTWYAFASDVLHDSGPIVGDRIFISLNLKKDYYDF
jgi:hypothetical protein